MSAALSPTSGSSYGYRRCCEAVREAVPIEEIARRYTELRPYGGRAWYLGRCPLPDHEDRTPSFYIYPGETGGRWWCYGCSRGGDVVDLEFSCGGYAEPWEAMISLAVEHDVELPRRPQSWHRWQEAKSKRGGIHDQLRGVLAGSYRRRLFRVFGPILEGIGEAEGREEEARRVWDDLWSVAFDLAERRLFEKRGAA